MQIPPTPCRPPPSKGRPFPPPRQTTPSVNRMTDTRETLPSPILRMRSVKRWIEKQSNRFIWRGGGGSRLRLSLKSADDNYRKLCVMLFPNRSARFGRRRWTLSGNRPLTSLLLLQNSLKGTWTLQLLWHKSDLKTNHKIQTPCSCTFCQSERCNGTACRMVDLKMTLTLFSRNIIFHVSGLDLLPN